MPEGALAWVWASDLGRLWEDLKGLGVPLPPNIAVERFTAYFTLAEDAFHAQYAFVALTHPGGSHRAYKVFLFSTNDMEGFTNSLGVPDADGVMLQTELDFSPVCVSM